MQINCENMIVTSNKDGTYKLKLLNCPFKDNNGEEINGMITFPRVSKDGVDSFKNENVLPKSEIWSVYIPEKEQKEIIVEGDTIHNLYEAYVWLRKAWEDEPYNMWYEDFGEKNTENYRECIFIEPVRGYEDLVGWDICSFEEFDDFIKNH